jgi:hypothetical protein
MFPALSREARVSTRQIGLVDSIETSRPLVIVFLHFVANFDLIEYLLSSSSGWNNKTNKEKRTKVCPSP